jgi:ribokinase
MAGERRDPPRFAVVGHVEWVDFIRVTRVPKPGEIVEARDSWAEAAGGGAVAAVQLAKLAGAASFFTALGNDDSARRAEALLRSHGVEVEARIRARPQRRAVAFLDAGGERTIAVIGKRLVPSGNDELPWGRLAEMDAVYFTGGDAVALRASRAAKWLVTTPRARDALTGSNVTVDALVRSAGDEGEQDDPERLGWSTRRTITTRGSEGGTYVGSDGRSGSFEAAPLTGPVVDAYGAGDSFAAGLTFGLGSGMDVDAALALGARCGAGNLTGSGPYSGQPTAADLGLPPRLIRGGRASRPTAPGSSHPGS